MIHAEPEWHHAPEFAPPGNFDWRPTIFATGLFIAAVSLFHLFF